MKIWLFIILADMSRYSVDCLRHFLVAYLNIEVYCYYFIIIIFFLNHYAPVSQANWCNMTFTAGNLFPSFMHLVTWVKPPPGFDPGSPDWEADDLPTELSLPPVYIAIGVAHSNKYCHWFSLVKYYV